jgi:hypothetical protein
MNQPALHNATAHAAVPHAMAGGSAAGRVTLRHLRTRAEIERVLPLRDGIDLSVHQAAGGQFELLEKKETNWVSSVRSSSMAS